MARSREREFVGEDASFVGCDYERFAERRSRATSA